MSADVIAGRGCTDDGVSPWPLLANGMKFIGPYGVTVAFMFPMFIMVLLLLLIELIVTEYAKCSGCLQKAVALIL